MGESKVILLELPADLIGMIDFEAQMEGTLLNLFYAKLIVNGFEEYCRRMNPNNISGQNDEAGKIIKEFILTRSGRCPLTASQSIKNQKNI